MYSLKQKMPETGEPVWINIKSITAAEESYFNGACFRLTEYAFKYDILPADEMGWTYDEPVEISVMPLSNRHSCEG